MANMSYCQFHNTLQDLLQCEDNLFSNDLSEDEKQARDRLIKVCRRIVDDVDYNFVDE